MTQQELREIAAECTHFLAGHYPRSVSQRMQDIADSPHAVHRVDMYGQGGYLQIFEAEIAELLGKESAVFMPSGTMAQPIALRIWADRSQNRNVAFHPKCHLQCHEHMAYQELHHLYGILLGKEDRLIGVDDIQAVKEPIGTLLLELPQRDIGGQLPPWDELHAQTAFARSLGMRRHLDGARLWETQPYYQREYKEIAADFDSAYVSFYKVLQGLPGAALAGPADFIDEARIWMRRQGGNLSTMAPQAISAKIGMERHLPRIPEYVAKAREIGMALSQMDGVTVVPSEPQTNMMHLHFSASEDSLRRASGEIARREKCLLVPYVSDQGEHRSCEITIGEAALDLPIERITTLFTEFVERTEYAPS